MSRDSEHIDSEVVSSLKRGDMKAFHKVFSAYSEQLFHFAYSYLKDSVESEEIVQEVFVRIWEIHAEIDESKSFKSFLYRMTVNKVFNHLKHQVVRQKYEKYLAGVDQSFNDSPEAQLHFEELDMKIRSLFEELPDQQRKIFELSRITGLSNAEIAEQLGLSVRTVENQVYRATRFLKEKLKGEYLFVIFCICFNLVSVC